MWHISQHILMYWQLMQKCTVKPFTACIIVHNKEVEKPQRHQKFTQIRLGCQRCNYYKTHPRTHAVTSRALLFCFWVLTSVPSDSLAEGSRKAVCAADIVSCPHIPTPRIICEGPSPHPPPPTHTFDLSFLGYASSTKCVLESVPSGHSRTGLSLPWVSCEEDHSDPRAQYERRKRGRSSLWPWWWRGQVLQERMVWCLFMFCNIV